MYTALKQIQNANGGGLSVAVTGKHTSVRHELAKLNGRLTAGEAAKVLSKSLKIKVLAKEVTAAYEVLTGREPEWHHAGFYKGRNGRSTMGRTFFFTDEHVEMLADRWHEVDQIKADKEARAMAQVKEAEKRDEMRRAFAKKRGMPFNRVTQPPKFSVIERTEMNGKYGWFEVEWHHSYNLTKYYSGIAFKSKKSLEKYLSI